MKILVLAGGADQMALIEELHRRGHEVILLDYLPNPPAKRVVATHIQGSTLDVEKVKYHAIKEKVDMVCTACTDQALLTVAKVSEELGLPCYISYSKALSVTNKSYMKRRMLETGVPTSKYIVCDEHSSLENLKNLSFPLVVKPADCNSSKGVLKVNSASECQVALREAIKLSRISTAILEEYKKGKEISVDFYINGDTPVLLSTSTSTKIKGRQGFTITGSRYPSVSEENEKDFRNIASMITKGFGLRDTPLLIQLIQADDKFYVIEFSARMGGGSKYKLIQRISGVDIIRADAS